MKLAKFFSAFAKICSFCKEKPEALFILIFQASLLASAVLSINGKPSLANAFATCAYISLVMVVVLQLVLLVKNERNKRQK